MVSQEVAVQFHRHDELPDDGPELEDGSRFHRRTATISSSNGADLASTDSPRKSRRHPGAGTRSAIEMRSLADRPVTHDGWGIHISNVEVDRFTEMATFVDELFAMCMETR